MTSIGFVGFGRFGAAMAQLCRDAGLAVRAHDPHADVPAPTRAASIDELVDAADVVVLAVPARSVEAAAEGVRPRLRAEQLVLDVASVKTGPVAALERVLGRDFAWVGTHPLFGPASIARGELPRRVVVCPNPLHPTAAPRARALYERIGCEVLEQDPDEHDRAMAWTHAIAFFVAKGLIDAGVRTDVPYAPPSFQTFARTVDTVRSDAGHLFATLHLDNPHAAEARRRLLDALIAIDHRLEHALEPPQSGEGTFAIPPSENVSPELVESRDIIDEVDREICQLLARRAQLARRIARVKAELGREIVDPEREARVLATRRAWARELALDPDAIETIFKTILCYSRAVQERLPLQGNEPEKPE